MTQNGEKNDRKLFSDLLTPLKEHLFVQDKNVRP